MNKQVKDLTVAEQDSFCTKQLKSSKSAKRVCGECPLRWAKHCVPCIPIMRNNHAARMMKVIGERTVEITENKR